MPSIFEAMFSSELKECGYSQNDEYIKDELKIVEMMLSYYGNRFLKGGYQAIKQCAMGDLKSARSYIDSRLSHTDEKTFLAGNYLRTICNLSDMEWFFVIVALAARLEPRTKQKLLKIDGTKKLKYCSVFKLYFFEEDVAKIENYAEMFFETKSKLGTYCFNGGIVSLDSRIFENILSNGKKDMDCVGAGTIYPKKSDKLLIREDVAERIRKFFENKREGEKGYCYVYGENGIGKTKIITRACDMLGRGLVCFDLLKNNNKINDDFFGDLKSVCREAMFLNSYICFEHFEEVIGEPKESGNNFGSMIEFASKFTDGIFICSSEEEKLPVYLRDNYSVAVKLENLSNEESFKVWTNELEGVEVASNTSIHELANKFTLTPAQIRRATKQAILAKTWSKDKLITPEEFADAAYTQITQKLSHQATLIKKKHTWDELVLPQAQKDALERACNQIKYKHVVYDEWNLKHTILYGRGLSMLFTGPPGTGKTMAAQVVANDLHLEIYRVDLSQVVSKYIGETEKNLAEIFDSAKKSNVVLLFDETDALFGKRTEVKDSHDKHANLETAYLLQKMEEYDGITIMTTNLLENLDQAFFRRISYVIHFPIPDENSRKLIWQKIYPKEAPIGDDVDFNFLAKKFEISGGNIKNVVITSTFMAAAESQKIGMKHIIKALEYEMKKQGKMMSKSDFGEYGYLL